MALLRHTLVVLSLDKRRMAADPRDPDMTGSHEGYSYRYSYNGAGRSQAWLGRDSFVVVDLSAGPCAFGPKGLEGATSAVLPRIAVRPRGPDGAGFLGEWEGHTGRGGCDPGGGLQGAGVLGYGDRVSSIVPRCVRVCLGRLMVTTQSRCPFKAGPARLSHSCTTSCDSPWALSAPMGGHLLS